MSTLKKQKAFISSFIFYIIILQLIITSCSTSAIASGDACRSLSCGSQNSIQVRFPFRLKDQQPNHCGYPGFELFCTNNNETIIELPFSGKFLVKSIDYKSQNLEIYDQNGCIPQRLIGFNISDTPFRTQEYGNYTFLNCSREVANERSYNYKTISCLSSPSSTYKILCLDSGDSLVGISPAGNCKLLASSIAWPNSYPYSGGKVTINSLNISWDELNCGSCEFAGGKCGYKNQNSSLPIGCFGIPPSSPSYHKPKGNNIAISLSLAGIFLFILTVLIIIIKMHKKTDKEEEENLLMIEQFLESYNALKPMRYSHADIKKITNKFKTKLGQGGYGSVFKGKLPNEIQVAVKILDNAGGSHNGEEFINEVGTIGRIHHLNVVRFLGFCVEGSMRALIYEFMPNSSLDKFIFSAGKADKKSYLLGWDKLQEISMGIARGIEYLHQGCDQRILHFDIKPQNILLDHNFTPKISDFGLAKLCTKGDSFISVSMAATRGTMGYIAPEVFSRNFGAISYKSDVYSFGVLLLEMAIGRKNTQIKTETNGDQIYFPEWIYNRLSHGEDLGIQVEAEEINVVKKLAMVALWCIQWNPIDRPSMKAVLHMLEGKTENLPMQPNPFASTSSTEISSSTNRMHDIELTVILED
ncbi:hypothetical protein MKW98_017193 [Papaver atlanticum]|uniref:Protein kinase domain-containing protein n=1 Tax=Papaver atlanticum TaxID=357466 RepID=A0AAD4SBD9_9MAGN|nr:hypothetical protein MKW98_017193 [Papaver atlanticum]